MPTTSWTVYATSFPDPDLWQGSALVRSHGWSWQGGTLSKPLLDTRAQDQVLADLKAAAGELRIPVPTPGTEMARLLSANVILRGRLRAETERCRKALCVFLGSHQVDHLPEGRLAMVLKSVLDCR